MLTVARCEQMALQTLGYDALPAEFSALEIVNRVGRWMCSAHPWTWLSRLGTVDVVGGQLYVDLSSLGSVSAVVKAAFTDSVTYYLKPTSLDDILDRRTSATPPSQPTYYALNTRIDVHGVLTRVLELDSAPPDNITAGVTLYYRSGLQIPEAGASSARVAIPEEWEGLFILGVRAVTRGYTEEESGTVDVRLSVLKRCDEFADLKRMDGMSQSSFGPLRGGGVEGQMTTFPELRYPRSI